MKRLNKTAKRVKLAYFDNDKAQALADYLEIDVEDITDYDYGYPDTCYETADGEVYRVLTEEEAHKAFEDYLEELIDEIGMEQTFGSYLNNAIYAGVDNDALRDFWYNDYYEYAVDIESEDDTEYGNRLIRECIEEELIDEEDVEDGEYIGDEDLYDLLATYLTDKLDGEFAEELLFAFDDDFALKVMEDYGAIDYSALVDWSLGLNDYGNWLSPIDGETHYLDNDYLAFLIRN